jgi:hypothetical protein
LLALDALKQHDATGAQHFAIAMNPALFVLNQRRDRSVDADFSNAT